MPLPERSWTCQRSPAFTYTVSPSKYDVAGVP